MNKKSNNKIQLTVLGLTTFTITMVGVQNSSSQVLFSNAKNNQCQLGALVTPDTETRQIQNQESKLSFNIPANYRAEIEQISTPSGVKEKAIFLINPAYDKLFQCCKKIKFLSLTV